MPTESKLDYFEIEVKKNRIYIAGNTNVALCNGAYTYLKDIGACNVSWKTTDSHYTKSAWGKYTISNTGSSYGWNSPINIKTMRYAEVLLIHAEACLMANDVTAGLLSINQVRERAHLPALTSLALEDIQNERFIELAGEYNRWFDIIRWGIAKEVMTAHERQYPWQDHFVLSPIPDLNISPALEQNPGY